MVWNIKSKVETSWKCWSLCQTRALALWSRLTETLPVAKKFKDRRILCDIDSKWTITIIKVDTLHGRKLVSCISSTITSYKKQNPNFVNLIIAVCSIQDYCKSNMKLRVAKKVVFFIVHLFCISSLYANP